MQIKNMYHMILRMNYGIIAILLFGCGRYSESEINSFKMVNRTFQEMTSIETMKIDKMINDMENVVYEDGEKPKDVAELKNVKNFDQLYKNVFSKISLLSKSNTSFNRKEVLLSTNEFLDKSKNSDLDLTWKNRSLLDAVADYSSMEIQILHLNELKLRTVHVASNLISYHSSQIGSDDYKFYSIYPMALGNDIIEEDSIYNAEIFISIPPAVKLKFNLEGRKDTIEKEFINFKIPAIGNNYDQNGFCKKSWDGTLIFRMHRKDTIINLHQDYYIRKPCN
jgi:hypothetical protein